MRDAFEKRRNYMVERIHAMEGISCLKPEGAFYIMIDVHGLYGKTICGELIQSDVDFVNAFLKHGLVALVPGDGFSAPGFVRWSYAASMDNIKEGLDRLERFLAQ